jgi:hypothetical protein
LIKCKCKNILTMPMHNNKLFVFFFLIYSWLKGKENGKSSVRNLEGGCGKEKEGNKGQIWLLLPTQLAEVNRKEEG